MRKRILAVTFTIMLASPALAVADPAFGPGNQGGGNGNSGPQDNGAKCHPPGQTVDEPGCK